MNTRSVTTGIVSAKQRQIEAPNGFKIAIALHEMGLPYDLHLVNIGQGEQFRPEFLAISPNNRS